MIVKDKQLLIKTKARVAPFTRPQRFLANPNPSLASKNTPNVHL